MNSKNATSTSKMDDRREAGKKSTGAKSGKTTGKSADKGTTKK